MNKTIIILIFLACTYGSAQAQNIATQTISWQVDSFKDMLTDTVVVRSSEFVSSPMTLQWIHKGGASVYTFVVNNTTGLWADVSTDGELTFAISYNNRPGEIIISRTSGQYRIRFKYNMTDEEKCDYTLNVSTIAVR